MSNSTHFSTKSCTEVSALCPVNLTILGYYPNLGVNAFLAAGFGLCLIGLVGVGIWKKTWGYSSALVAGCALEFAGYIARVQMHKNPWSKDAFETQICAIILAPTLICISIYLTLKHATLSVSPSLSRIRPRLYPAFFVPADVSCLILQAIGGGMAASAGNDNAKLLLAGNRVIITGIALQVVVLFFFGGVSTDYFLRARKWMQTEEATPAAKAVWADKKVRTFFFAISAAYFGIVIRCIYRIAEFSGGWGSDIMRDEPSFIVLEGFMVLIPVALLTIFSPGIFFSDMALRESQRFRKKGGEKSGELTPDVAEAEPKTDNVSV